MESSSARIKRPEAGIEKLLGQYTPRDVEAEGKMHTEQNMYAVLLGTLEECLEIILKDEDFFLDEDGSLEMLEDTLTPAQINQFLQITQSLERHPPYIEEYQSCQEYIGAFISKLIQNSYAAGHNDFQLDLPAFTIPYIGYRLQGTKKKPITVTIKGDRVDACGDTSKHAIFRITADRVNTCGELAHHSTFIILGEPAEFSHARSTKDLTFKTTNRGTLRKMLKDVPKRTRVVYIHPDGEEEIVRDYK